MKNISSSSVVNTVRFGAISKLQIGIYIGLDDRNMHYKIYIDIKSELLRDVLRQVLIGIPTVSLHGDKPEVVLFRKIPMWTTYAILDTNRDFVPLLVPNRVEARRD